MVWSNSISFSMLVDIMMHNTDRYIAMWSGINVTNLSPKMHPNDSQVPKRIAMVSVSP